MTRKELGKILYNSKELRDIIYDRMAELNLPIRSITNRVGVDRVSFIQWINRVRNGTSIESVFAILNSLGIYIKIIDGKVGIIKYPLDCSIFDVQYRREHLTLEESAEFNKTKLKKEHAKTFIETVRRLTYAANKGGGNAHRQP